MTLELKQPDRPGRYRGRGSKQPPYLACGAVSEMVKMGMESTCHLEQYARRSQTGWDPTTSTYGTHTHLTNYETALKGRFYQARC